MPNQDIRWIQRFNNYRRALARLTDAVQQYEDEGLNELEQQGLIQGFEFTFDLAWKSLQDFLRQEGFDDVNSNPNAVITKSLEEGYIKNEEGWKNLKKSRDLASHTYNEETAIDIIENIIELYHSLFIQLETRLQVEKINQEKQG